MDTGRALQTTANISLAVGIVGLVAGTTLLFVGPRTEREPQPASTTLSLGLGEIHLHGAF